MKTLILICFAFGIFNVFASATNKPNKITTTKQIADDTTVNTAAATATNVAKELTNDATKDKRQTKDTKDAATATVYSNHRSDTASITSNQNRNTNSDDPEDPQETIYGTNARQFLIRPQHQQQQNEEEQLQQQLIHQQPHQQQLRNYAATIRPHSTQLLEQSQEIQHYAYLQDLNRNQQKVQIQGKSQMAQNKKSTAANGRGQSQQQQQQQSSQVEEAEQRYAVAVEQPIPQHHPRAHTYRPQIPYHIALHQQQQQEREHQNSQQQQQQYQIIPEEQFLKILEEELHARQVYRDEQVRLQQAAQQQQNQQHQQQQHIQHQHQQQQQQQSAAAAASQKVSLQSQGLGNYRQRIESEDGREQPEYVQYVQRPRGGPKYLPLPQGPQQEEQTELDSTQQHPLPQLPPQIAYYQPQISYKTLPNHPLAKSSLEKEIEKLLAINKPDVSPVQIIDNSNEPSALINHHHVPQHSPRPHISPKAYIPSTAAPNNLLDGNNQPFIPSLFRFSSFQQPTQNYPSQLPQQVIDAKKLGPVVYPAEQSQSPSVQPPVQASQFYYQEAAPSPSPRPKPYRSKYGTKFPTTPTPIKAHQNEIQNYPVLNKYAQPLLYDIERPSPTAGSAAPTHFYPSPPDPHRNIPSPPTAQPTPAVTTKYSPTPTDFRQYALPGPSPSQSSIYVSQGTGIATPSRPISTVKPKTIEELKQLHLPQPGGKPLTQSEFQALVDAGYPVTAVPVPVPIPYEQYVKDNPNYRNQPPPQAPALPVNYEHLMRFAQLQQHHQVPQYGPHRSQQHLHQRSIVPRPSEPSVKIISSASEPQAATAIGGGSITHLRAIPENQKRRPRDETDTKVLGAKEEEKNEQVAEKQIAEKQEK